MSKYLSLLYLASIAIVFSLAACDEPSTVGAELIEGEGGFPDSEVVPLSAAQDTMAAVTGNARRVLAGVVNDPVVGTISATGYLDFAASASVDSSFRSKNLRLVFLDLFLDDYTYGDTTGTVTLRLRNMPAEWEADGATADTSLIGGSPIKEFTFTADDSLVTVQLPSAWVQAYERELLSENFSDAFHGFQLEPRSGEAIVGFDGSRSRLRAVAGVDTATYSISKSLTTVRRTGEKALPPNRQVIQDGTGLIVRLTLPDSSLVPADVAVLNRAELRIDFDTETLKSTPDFFRPKLQLLRLCGVAFEDDVEQGAAPIVCRFPGRTLTLRRTEGGEYVLGFNETERLRQLLQARLRRGPIFKRFVLTPVPVVRSSGGPLPGPTRQLVNSLNVALLYAQGAPHDCGPNNQTCEPRLRLVFTPVD